MDEADVGDPMSKLEIDKLEAEFQTEKDSVTF